MNGDGVDNTITLSRDVADQILVNNGVTAVVAVRRRLPTSLIRRPRVDALTGDDTDLNEGGAGTDTVEVNGTRRRWRGCLARLRV